MVCGNTTYAVEDWYFTITGADERYDRLVQVVERVGERFTDPEWVNNAKEINGIKYLFRPGQAWTVESAHQFIEAAHARLLDS